MDTLPAIPVPDPALLAGARRDYASICRNDAARIEQARRTLRLTAAARVFLAIQPVGLGAEHASRLDNILGLAEGADTLDGFLAAEATRLRAAADRLEAQRRVAAP